MDQTMIWIGYLLAYIGSRILDGVLMKKLEMEVPTLLTRNDASPKTFTIFHIAFCIQDYGIRYAVVI